MKKIFNSFLIVAVMASVASISSCTKVVDPCEGVVCNNGGTCVTGTCNCVLGYEGTTCSTEVRAKYLGNFNGGETCNPSGNSTYAVNVLTVTTDVTKVTFNNLYAAGFNTTGTVQADGTVIIATQSFGSGTISGTAVITSSKVKVTYVVSAGGVSDNCVWTQS